MNAERLAKLLYKGSSREKKGTTMDLSKENLVAIKKLIAEEKKKLIEGGIENRGFAEWQAKYAVASSLDPPVAMPELELFLQESETDSVQYIGEFDGHVIEEFESIPDRLMKGHLAPQGNSHRRWLRKMVTGELLKSEKARRIHCDNRNAARAMSAAAYATNPHNKASSAHKLPKGYRVVTRIEPVNGNRKDVESAHWLWLQVIAT